MKNDTLKLGDFGLSKEINNSTEISDWTKTNEQ